MTQIGASHSGELLGRDLARDFIRKVRSGAWIKSGKKKRLLFRSVGFECGKKPRPMNSVKKVFFFQIF
jgi:hypothetical protein